MPVPPREEIEGLTVWHPRYAVLPKVALWTHAAQMRACLAPALNRIRREYSFDLLFATWAFPDVVAAAGMAARWGVPLAAKVHGTDVLTLTLYPLRRLADCPRPGAGQPGGGRHERVERAVGGDWRAGAEDPGTGQRGRSRALPDP